jgi:hypothetical protein
MGMTGKVVMLVEFIDVKILLTKDVETALKDATKIMFA